MSNNCSNYHFHKFHKNSNSLNSLSILSLLSLSLLITFFHIFSFFYLRSSILEGEFEESNTRTVIRSIQRIRIEPKITWNGRRKPSPELVLRCPVCRPCCSVSRCSFQSLLLSSPVRTSVFSPPQDSLKSGFVFVQEQIFFLHFSSKPVKDARYLHQQGRGSRLLEKLLSAALGSCVHFLQIASVRSWLCPRCSVTISERHFQVILRPCSVSKNACLCVWWSWMILEKF